MKLLAIDFGIRRIGVSVSDPTATLVRPLITIDRKITPKYFEALLSIIYNEEVDKVIFGLPLDHDDNETEMCANIRSFSQKLLNLLPDNFPYDFQDESYSSVRTHAIVNRTKSKKKRSNKGTIDKIAASIILEDYIRISSGNLLLY